MLIIELKLAYGKSQAQVAASGPLLQIGEELGGVVPFLILTVKNLIRADFPSKCIKTEAFYVLKAT